MHRYIYLCFFVFVLFGCSNQDDELEPIAQPAWTQKEFSINYGGINRRYIIYKPKSYTENSPLLLMLHGFGSNMKNILAYSNTNYHKRFLIKSISKLYSHCIGKSSVF